MIDQWSQNGEYISAVLLQTLITPTIVVQSSISLFLQAVMDPAHQKNTLWPKISYPGWPR